jgi:hypothetical protein
MKKGVYMKKILFIVSGIVFMLVCSNIAFACTGFTASDDEKVLVGINEDSFNTRRYIEIFPPEEGKFGIIYFCYEIAFRQQAMNDQGLFYDGYWAPHLDIVEGEGKPPPDGWMIDEWMENCTTVDEVVDEFEKYDWNNTGIEDAMLLFVDRYGNSAIIEGDEIIFKEGDFQAVTNFYQSNPDLGGVGFDRYATAISMLENMTDFSMDYFRDICDATHQLGSYPTIYSLVCNLSKNIIHYYRTHDFENVWVINLTEEFEFGEHTYDVLDVFNNNVPEQPNRPNGQKNGKINTEYNFSCKTFDEDGDKLYYKWDWGDGNFSNWLGPFNPAQKCTAVHSWSTNGTYEIRVMARDINCGKSSWSKPLLVKMPYIHNHVVDLSGWIKRFPLLVKVFEFINNLKTSNKADDEVEIDISAGFHGKDFGFSIAVDILNNKNEDVEVTHFLTLDYLLRDHLNENLEFNITVPPDMPYFHHISPVICYPDGVKFFSITVESEDKSVTRSGLSIRNFIILLNKDSPSY